MHRTRWERALLTVGLLAGIGCEAAPPVAVADAVFAADAPTGPHDAVPLDGPSADALPGEPADGGPGDTGPAPEAGHSPQADRPPSPDDECLTDADCGPEPGWFRCQLATERCVPDPLSRTLRITRLSGGWPDGSATVVFRSAITGSAARGAMNLLVHVGQEAIYLVQGLRAGEIELGAGVFARYRSDASLPVYRLDEDPVAACAGHTDCRISAGSGREALTLIPGRPEEAGEVCAVGAFEATISLALDRRLERVAVRSGATSRMEWVLPAAAAYALDISGTNLGTLLAEERPLRDAPPDEVEDLNGDGVPDAWRFSYEVGVEAVGFADAPVACPDCRPDDCDD